MTSLWLLTGLLLTAHCCSAMLLAPNAAAPSQCCFTFFTRNIDPSQILSVVKTGSRCSKKGFIVTTRRGKVCVDLKQDWLKHS